MWVTSTDTAYKVGIHSASVERVLDAAAREGDIYGVRDGSEVSYLYTEASTGGTKGRQVGKAQNSGNKGRTSSRERRLEMLMDGRPEYIDGSHAPAVCERSCGHRGSSFWGQGKEWVERVYCAIGSPSILGGDDG